MTCSQGAPSLVEKDRRKRANIFQALLSDIKDKILVSRWRVGKAEGVVKEIISDKATFESRYKDMMEKII